MTTPYVQTGLQFIEEQCDVIAVKNYGTTDIADGSLVVIDLTNLDTTQGLLAVATTTTAQDAKRIGIAKGKIPAGGQGEVVTSGFVRAIGASGAWTAGNRVTAAAVAGQIVENTTAGAVVGFTAKTETTTTPLIFVAFS